MSFEGIFVPSKALRIHFFLTICSNNWIASGSTLDELAGLDGPDASPLDLDPSSMASESCLAKAANSSNASRASSSELLRDKASRSSKMDSCGESCWSSSDASTFSSSFSSANRNGERPSLHGWPWGQ